MQNNFEIQGLKQVEEALGSLPIRLKAEILGRANKDILNRLVRPKIRQGTQQRRKRIRTATYARNDKSSIVIGIHLNNFWLRFLDKGTVQRRTRKGYNRGVINPNNNITSIINNSANPVIKEVRENYGDIIAKHLNRKITQVNKKLSRL